MINLDVIVTPFDSLLDNLEPVLFIVTLFLISMIVAAAIVVLVLLIKRAKRREEQAIHQDSLNPPTENEDENK